MAATYGHLGDHSPHASAVLLSRVMGIWSLRPHRNRPAILSAKQRTFPVERELWR